MNRRNAFNGTSGFPYFPPPPPDLPPSLAALPPVGITRAGTFPFPVQSYPFGASTVGIPTGVSGISGIRPPVPPFMGASLTRPSAVMTPQTLPSITGIQISTPATGPIPQPPMPPLPVPSASKMQQKDGQIAFVSAPKTPPLPLAPSSSAHAQGTAHSSAVVVSKINTTTKTYPTSRNPVKVEGIGTAKMLPPFVSMPPPPMPNGLGIGGVMAGMCPPPPLPSSLLSVPAPDFKMRSPLLRSLSTSTPRMSVTTMSMPTASSSSTSVSTVTGAAMRTAMTGAIGVGVSSGSMPMLPTRPSMTAQTSVVSMGTPSFVPMTRAVKRSMSDMVLSDSSPLMITINSKIRRASNPLPPVPVPAAMQSAVRGSASVFTPQLQAQAFAIPPSATTQSHTQVTAAVPVFNGGHVTAVGAHTRVQHAHVGYAHGGHVQGGHGQGHATRVGQQRVAAAQAHVGHAHGGHVVGRQQQQVFGGLPYPVSAPVQMDGHSSAIVDVQMTTPSTSAPMPKVIDTAVVGSGTAAKKQKKIKTKAKRAVATVAPRRKRRRKKITIPGFAGIKIPQTSSDFHWNRAEMPVSALSSSPLQGSAKGAHSTTRTGLPNATTTAFGVGTVGKNESEFAKQLYGTISRERSGGRKGAVLARAISSTMNGISVCSSPVDDNRDKMNCVLRRLSVFFLESRGHVPSKRAMVTITKLDESVVDRICASFMRISFNEAEILASGKQPQWDILPQIENPITLASATLHLADGCFDCDFDHLLPLVPPTPLRKPKKPKRGSGNGNEEGSPKSKGKGTPLRSSAASALTTTSSALGSTSSLSSQPPIKPKVPKTPPPKVVSFSMEPLAKGWDDPYVSSEPTQGFAPCLAVAGFPGIEGVLIQTDANSSLECTQLSRVKAENYMSSVRALKGVPSSKYSMRLSSMAMSTEAVAQLFAANRSPSAFLDPYCQRAKRCVATALPGGPLEVPVQILGGTVKTEGSLKKRQMKVDSSSMSSHRKCSTEGEYLRFADYEEACYMMEAYNRSWFLAVRQHSADGIRLQFSMLDRAYLGLSCHFIASLNRQLQRYRTPDWPLVEFWSAYAIWHFREAHRIEMLQMQKMESEKEKAEMKSPSKEKESTTDVEMDGKPEALYDYCEATRGQKKTLEVGTSSSVGGGGKKLEPLCDFGVNGERQSKYDILTLDCGGLWKLIVAAHFWLTDAMIWQSKEVHLAKRVLCRMFGLCEAYAKPNVLHFGCLERLALATVHFDIGEAKQHANMLASAFKCSPEYKQLTHLRKVRRTVNVDVFCAVFDVLRGSSSGADILGPILSCSSLSSPASIRPISAAASALLAQTQQGEDGADSALWNLTLYLGMHFAAAGNWLLAKACKEQVQKIKGSKNDVKRKRFMCMFFEVWSSCLFDFVCDKKHTTTAKQLWENKHLSLLRLDKMASEHLKCIRTYASEVLVEVVHLRYAWILAKCGQWKHASDHCSFCLDNCGISLENLLAGTFEAPASCRDFAKLVRELLICLAPHCGVHLMGYKAPSTVAPRFLKMRPTLRKALYALSDRMSGTYRPLSRMGVATAATRTRAAAIGSAVRGGRRVGRPTGSGRPRGRPPKSAAKPKRKPQTKQATGDKLDWMDSLPPLVE